MLKKIKLFGIGITNANEQDILEYIVENLKVDNKLNKKVFITTPNPEIIMYAHKHPAYADILNKADIALPDGVGVFIAAGLLGTRLKERIPGADFIERICKSSINNPISIGFLGASSGVAQLTAERLKEKYPHITVAFARKEWDHELEKSLTSPVDILFVAFGFPKQEEWIASNLKHLPIRAAMGVGGAFDYISGNTPRAPYLIRAMGFEWLFRLIIQPWRIKRQLVLISFTFLVLKQLVGRPASLGSS